MQYTSQAKIENFLQRSLTAQELAILPDLIESVSDGIIEAYTGRRWLNIGETVDGYGEEEDKLYDGNGGKELPVDDFTALDKVDILDASGGVYLSLTAANEFVLYPLNATVKESIHLRNYTFPRGAARVLVTAIFSSGEVPEGIIYVATALASRFIELQGESAEFKKESIEGYSYEVLEASNDEGEMQTLLSRLDRWKKASL